MRQCSWYAGVLALLASFHLAVTAQADVRLPKFMGDHMVLQREMPVPIWGWASPGESVTVTLGDETATTTANDRGEWRVTLAARPAGGPHTLEVKAANTVKLSDILFGEVWLCSGQSNMEWTVQVSANAAEEIAAANFPQIRQVKIPRLTSPVPQNDVQGTWQVCSPKTAGSFTAVGYFMARVLNKELNVPIGLINSSWGGTRIEPWTPPVGFAGVPELKDLSDQIARRMPGSPAFHQNLKDYEAALHQWITQARLAASTGKPLPAPVAYPDDLKAFSANGEPTTLYNAMIHPLLGWPIRGVIWYQGESNSGEGMLYRAKMQALIEGWRKLWGQGDFPFYFVQIAPFQYGNTAPDVLPRLWEAQAAATAIPQTGMVVINDIATLNDIHPPNKQDVGKRLANLALKRTYGKNDIVDTGATFKSLTSRGNELVVAFDNVAGGLKSRDGKPLTHFEIISPEQGWTAADARIEGDQIILSAKGVTQPVAMRFAWHKLAEPNLINGAGLPTSAFRAGDVPKVDFSKSIEEVSKYQLIYDVDLSKLGATISYSVDESQSFKEEFDRVAYLVELQEANGTPQYVYASMDAFTKDVKLVGIPTAESKASFQRTVSKLTVRSNTSAVSEVTDSDGGNIEFWPDNYGPQNTGNVPGAANDKYDFGDSPQAPREGYGSMQIHHFKAKQTVFAVNNWKAGPNADVGIGNSSGDTLDWTFTRSASKYSHARLRVFVRPTQK